MNRILLFLFFLLIYHYFSISRVNDQKKNRWFLILVSILLILDSAMRNLGVGADTYQYYLRFEKTKSLPLDYLWQNFLSMEGKDSFYTLIQKVFQIWFPRYHLWLGFIATFYFSALGLFLYRSKLSLVQLLVAYCFYLQFFYSFFSWTGARQTLAVSCVMFAYIALLDNRKRYFYVLTLLGFWFHASAIISLLVLIVRRIKTIGFYVFLIPFTLPFLYMFASQLSRWFIVDTFLEDRFAQYTVVAEGTGSLYVTAVYLLVFVGMYVYYNKIVQEKIYLFNVQLYVVTIFLLPLLYVSNTAHRVAYYFSMSMFVIIPVILKFFRFQGRYLIAILLILTLTFVVAYKSRTYYFYWQKMELVDENGRLFVYQEPFY